ncbi:DUF167 domain-containing protein [Petrachloros mirabilis]
MNSPLVHDSVDGAVLAVHVQPKASRTECVGTHGDALKIRVAAPPVDGAANEELIRFLAQEFSIVRSSIQIESGATGRRKRIRLQGVTAEGVIARLIEKRKGL